MRSRALGFYTLRLSAYGVDYIEGATPKDTSVVPNQTIFNIESINAPSVIGSQQSVTQNIGITSEDIAKIIEGLPRADREALNGLTNMLHDLENGNRPIKKGMLAKYADTLLKYMPLISALGNFTIKVMTLV